MPIQALCYELLVAFWGMTTCEVKLFNLCFDINKNMENTTFSSIKKLTKDIHLYYIVVFLYTKYTKLKVNI